MAEVDISPRFGAELKDGFKGVNTWVANGISWLDDIQSFYRERSAVEKEYAAKLNALAKKYHERKARKSTSLGVGDTPTMTPGSLESASVTTWTTQLSTLESRAAEHERYSTELVMQVAEPLKKLSARYEELRKSHAEFAATLERERDGSYNELRKVKGRYDGACNEVEHRRKKTESSFDSSKQKAQSAYAQQVMDMHNVKNTYIIAINVTNMQKEKYYHEYVPELLDSLQDLSETRVNQLNALWLHASQLEKSALSRSTTYVTNLEVEIPRNEPRLDSMMFLRHNVGNWQEPLDLVFEPSPVWHDDDLMAVDESAKVFLRNMLGKSKPQLAEYKREVDKKRREIENVRRLRQSIREGRDKRDEVEVVKGIFAMQEDLHQVERKRLTAQVETSTITSTVGDISVGAQNHSFKSQTFKIPTNCDLCGERIWGLSAKGFDCKDCGYTCHSKCEMKVPADCPGEQSKEERKKLKTERQAAANAAHPQPNGSDPPEGVTELPALSRSNTMDTLSSGYAASAHRSVSGVSVRTPVEDLPEDRSTPALQPISKPNTLRKNRVVAPPPSQYVSELPSNGHSELGGDSSSRPTSKSGETRGKALYAYAANGEGELSIEEGQEVVILEPDDGSGWMTVRPPHGPSGIVPAAYFETLATSNTLSPSHPSPSLTTDRPGSTYSNSSTSTTATAPTGGGGKKRGPAVAPKRGAKVLKHVEALYDYDARSEAEWSMRGGERFILVSGDGGDGWCDVERGGRVASVPANYVREV